MTGRKLPASKRRTKLSSDYARRRGQVERQLLAKKAELQQAEVELQESGELLQVLAAVISQQEQLQPILLQHNIWIEQLACGNAQQPHESEQATSADCWPAAAAAAVQHAAAAARHAPNAATGSGYVLGLLASATREEVQQAVLTTPEQLRESYVDFFRVIAPLVELAWRSAETTAAAAEAGDASQPGCCTASAAAGASKDVIASSKDAGVQRLSGQSSQSSINRCAAPTAVAGSDASGAAAAVDAEPPAAAAAAAAAAGCGACEYPAGMQTTVDAALAELHCRVDASLRFNALILLHNPLVIYSIAATNAATGEVAMAPPHHWLLGWDR
uniref:Uncharacterized protein n=1 Tax=Tetradesmus obliquus TaxID=3088 RepID=A0A383VFA3_TETOB|eukprot:jgi/Sobl393_1/18843/SZX63459.1